MPELIRLYIVSVLIGFAISALFLGVVLAIDLADLRHLILETPSGTIAGFVFFFLNGIVFAGVQFAIAVMSMAEDAPPGPGGGLRHLTRLVPVKAEVKDEAQQPRR